MSAYNALLEDIAQAVENGTCCSPGSCCSNCHVTEGAARIVRSFKTEGDA